MPLDIARAKELFLAVLDMAPAERAAYLDQACGGEAALRGRIEGMLESHAQSGGLLTRTPREMLRDSGVTEADATAAFGERPDQAATSLGAGEGGDLSYLTPSATPGHLGRLGHYEVKQVLGKGGFGIVLRGFDERLHRVVAIKV